MLEENFKVTLQPLADVHLKSSGILFENYNLNKTDISYVYTLAAVGLFVILIASFNFMNLSTARSANRAQEVGVRKVFGAFRAQLINQFMIESVVLCVVSFLIALVLVSLTGGLVNLPIEQNLALFFLSNPQWLGGALLLSYCWAFFREATLPCYSLVSTLLLFLEDLSRPVLKGWSSVSHW